MGFSPHVTISCTDNFTSSFLICMPLFFVLPSLEPLVKCRLENTIKCARIDLFGLFLILEGKHSVFDHWVWCRFSVGASPFPGWGHFLLSENFLLWMGVEDRFLIVNFSIFFCFKKNFKVFNVLPLWYVNKNKLIRTVYHGLCWTPY